MTAPSEPCRCPAPAPPMAALPIALATSSPERRQRNLSRGIAETLEDSIELARRFRARHGADRPRPARVRPPIAATLDDSKRLAQRFSQRSRHSIATTLEESKQLAERWRARSAPSIATTLAESYELARRFERGELRPAAPRHPAPQGRLLPPSTLAESIALEARRAKATTSASLEDAKAAAERFGARSAAGKYDVNEIVKGPLLRGPDAVVERPVGPALTPLHDPGPGGLGGSTTATITEPVTFRNALWTAYPVVSIPGRGVIEYVEFVDVAAGGEYVWAVSSLGDVYVLHPGTSEFERADGAPAATRVEVLSDGSPVLAARHAGPPASVSIGRHDGDGWKWIDVPFPVFDNAHVPLDVGVIDVAAGSAQDDFPYGQIAVLLSDHRIFSLSHGFVPVQGGRAVKAIALAADGAPIVRDSDDAKLYRLWAVADNGDVLVGPGWAYANPPFPVSFEPLQPLVTPFAASDVGVDAQGVAFVADSSGDAWQLDTFGNRWLDTRGKAKAVAAGPDGSMWIVGQDGKIYNRGGRKFGFWEAGTRSRPKPGQTWCEFELNPDVIARVQDGINRFVEGGASVLRIGQVSADAHGNDTTDKITEEGVLLAAANLGVDVFVLFDVIRTALRVVPYPNPSDSENHMSGIPDYRYMRFDNPLMIDWFKGAFKKFKDNVDARLAGEPNQPRRFEDVIKYISIGGEVDVYLNTTTLQQEFQWDAWIDFYHEVSAYIRTLVPRVEIGCVLTLHYRATSELPFGSGAWGMFNDPKARALLEALNATSDYIGYTSYPGANPPLDDPSNDVPERILQMLEIAGDKPVIVEEFGYPTYDNATIQNLKNNWPGHSFPTSFFTGYDAGETAQADAVNLAFDAWDEAKLRLPVFVWFTAYELHIEGRGCNRWPSYALVQWHKVETPLPAGADPSYFGPMCNPCVGGADNPDCHPCGALDGLNTLGLGAGEDRFFGSCGLIRSNGEPKAGWDDVVADTAERRVPRGTAP